MKTQKKETEKKSTTTKNQVKPKSNAASDLNDFFEDGLKDIYWAEKALVNSLPKMKNNATNDDLIAAIEDHLEETIEQVARLEKVFESIGKKPVAKKCDAMHGLIEEGSSILEETEPGVVRDAGIIAASQKIEHYEIASYGTLHAYAQILGFTKAAKLLDETLQEEKEADVTLTELALSAINLDAVSA